MLAAEQDMEAATQQEPQMLAAEQDTVAATQQESPPTVEQQELGGPAAATPTEPEKLQVQPEEPRQQHQVGDELLVPGGADIDGDDVFCSIGDAAFAAMSASFTSALQGLQRPQEVSAVEEAQLQLPQEVGAVEGAGDHAAVRIDESQPASQMEDVTQDVL